MVKFFFIIYLAAFFQVIGQNGNLRTYYPSGKVASRLAFIKDVLEGTSYWYYENGNVKESKEYSNGKLNGITRTFYESGLLKSETTYQDGMLHGVSKMYYENGGLKGSMTYNYGELTNSRSIQYDSLYIAPLSAYEAGKKKKDMESNDFICPVDICPEPVGGLEEIEKKLVYPELAKQFKLEGYVLLTAAINLRGKPVNIRVNKGLGLGCDEAAVEAVKNTNFIPGRNKGEEVETDVTFKVSFRLSDEDDRAPNSGENIEISGTETAAANSLDENEGFIECDSDICPKPVGGIIELLNNLKYPPQAERNNISGNVIVEAEVDELGFVISAEIIKGIGYGCDEAAKRAVIKTQFEPGQENNMDSKSKIKITVPFILNNE